MLKTGTREMRGVTRTKFLERSTKKFGTGFTLVEAMITTAILSLGIVLIYEAFFISLDSFNYCSNYLNIVSWADEKVWQTQNSLNHYGVERAIGTQGVFKRANKKFNWNLSFYLIDVDLYRIDLDIFWQEGKRKSKLSRSAYALYNEEDDE